MMRDMSRSGQPIADVGAAPERRWWLLPALAAVLAAYVLWMGETLAWNHQHGPYWYFLGPWWTPTSLRYLAMAAALAAGFFFAGARLRRGMPWALAAVLLGGQIWSALAAWRIVGGQVPWGFDHPSFMFRLKEFGDLFPFALGGYSPWWNAGTEHFVGVTSGAHGFGVLLLPLLKLWEPHAFYGAALVFWFVFGFPWLGAIAARAAGAGREGALCAGILLCGASRGVFLWAWHFGTVGAMTSAMMALPVVALGYRLAVLRRGGFGTALALGLAAWLMCLWTPGVFIGAGLALGWLWNFRAWSWRSNRWLFAAGALALLLLAPWLWTTMFPCRNVVEYVGMKMDLPAWTVMASRGASRLMVAVQEFHPVIAVLGLLGALVAAPRDMRRWMLPLFGVLAAIAGWSRELKPLSQLDRMAIPLATVAAFPAAALCGRLFGGGPGAAAGRGRRWAWAAAQGVVLATLLMGFRAVRLHYANAKPGPLRTMPAGMNDLAEWIRANVPEDARLGFAGRAVHIYGGGNVAYLPILTGREMMADDYYGFPRGTIEYNYPPGFYRRSFESFLFFSRAYGISHWIATDPELFGFMENQPDQFETAFARPALGRDVRIYRLKDPGPGTRFYEGAGRVAARENRIDVFPADPAAERLVLRYNWRDGLFCRTPGAAIEPFAVDDNLRFIAVKPGGNGRVAIGYRPHAAPIQPNFDGYFHH